MVPPFLGQQWEGGLLAVLGKGLDSPALPHQQRPGVGSFLGPQGPNWTSPSFG